MNDMKKICEEYANKLVNAKIIDESQWYLIHDSVKHGYNEALKQICTLDNEGVYFIRDAICERFDKK